MATIRNIIRARAESRHVASNGANLRFYAKSHFSVPSKQMRAPLYTAGTKPQMVQTDSISSHTGPSYHHFGAILNDRQHGHKRLAFTCSFQKRGNLWLAMKWVERVHLLKLKSVHSIQSHIRA